MVWKISKIPDPEGEHQYYSCPNKESTLTIGRRHGDLIFTEDKSLSRKHLTVSFFLNKISVEDLKSGYGTFYDSSKSFHPKIEDCKFDSKIDGVEDFEFLEEEEEEEIPSTLKLFIKISPSIILQFQWENSAIIFASQSLNASITDSSVLEQMLGISIVDVISSDCTQFLLNENEEDHLILTNRNLIIAIMNGCEIISLDYIQALITYLAKCSTIKKNLISLKELPKPEDYPLKKDCYWDKEGEAINLQEFLFHKSKKNFLENIKFVYYNSSKEQAEEEFIKLFMFISF